MIRTVVNILRGTYKHPATCPRLFQSWPRYASVAAKTSGRIHSPVPLGSLQEVRLRDYQEECIQSVLSYLDRGENRLGISLATGSGKTVIFTQLIDRIKPPTPIATQALILVHRRELVEQAARHCNNAYPNKSIEVEMGADHASGAADITVASIQSINSGERISKFDASRFKLVLVDEAHHIVANQYLKTLEFFGLRHKGTSPTALVGVSATFSRFDGLKLGSAIDHIVYHKDYVDMIEGSWLSNVIFTTVQSKADLTRVGAAKEGDFQIGALSKAVNTPEQNDVVFKAWNARARDRKSTLIFCVDLAHLSALTALFRAYGVDARFVTGNTRTGTRSERVDGFRRGEFPVLLNVGVFTEGTDIPNIDCVLLARPTRSQNLLVQMIGRGMRLHPGKKNCHIIDMVSSLETGIVTTPTLLGLDPDEIVEEADIEKLKDLRTRKEQEQALEQHAAIQQSKVAATPTTFKGSITFTDYASVNDLIEDSSPERHIRATSPHTWVQVGEDRYVLSANTGSFLTILRLPDEDVYVARFTQKLPGNVSKSPFARPREVVRSPTFNDIVHAADTFAAKKFPRMFIHRNEAWRKKPASEAQVKFLNKTRDADSQLTPETVTKGRATDMITKLKFGAKGWFEKTEAKKREQQRHEDKKAKREALRARERVQVGPMQAEGTVVKSEELGTGENPVTKQPQWAGREGERNNSEELQAGLNPTTTKEKRTKRPRQTLEEALRQLALQSGRNEPMQPQDTVSNEKYDGTGDRNG